MKNIHGSESLLLPQREKRASASIVAAAFIAAFIAAGGISLYQLTHGKKETKK